MGREEGQPGHRPCPPASPPTAYWPPSSSLLQGVSEEDMEAVSLRES